MSSMAQPWLYPLVTNTLFPMTSGDAALTSAPVFQGKLHSKFPLPASTPSTMCPSMHTY
jgi:hypothetical protein